MASRPQRDPDVRPWVARLGMYLRIFGPPAPGTMGWRTTQLDHLERMAKEREAEHGR